MPADKPALWRGYVPAAYDIVTCRYPLSELPDRPGPKLRPCLVTAVLRRPADDMIACRVAFGTTSLRITQSVGRDLIIQDAADLSLMGLASPTRFDLGRLAVLPWSLQFFDCWTGYESPRLGTLLEAYIKEYAYCMMRRGSA